MMSLCSMMSRQILLRLPREHSAVITARCVSSKSDDKKKRQKKELEEFENYANKIADQARHRSRKRVENKGFKRDSDEVFKTKENTKQRSRTTNVDEAPNVTNLIKAAQVKNVELAERILTKLRQQPRFELGAGLCVLLLDMYMRLGECSSALDTLAEMRQLHPDSHMLPSRILQLSLLLCENGECHECLRVLTQESALLPEVNEYDEAEREREAPSALLSKLSHQLLASAQTKAKPELCTQLADVILKHKFAVASKPLLAPCVNAYVGCKDLEGALRVFVQLKEKHRILPGKSLLQKALLHTRDFARVEELMEHSAEVIGRDNSAYDLVISLVELRELDKATIVLEKTKVLVSSERLLYRCSHAAARGDMAFVRDVHRVMRRTSTVAAFVTQALEEHYPELVSR